ncbi:transporter substrate-binding domain-containing protein [Poseidonocella sp. HB161398]|uniref:transporter substrate-binding domain-containing protein n=1 Tax=Poseidonocella sp. HB161398 TaxID=2320855 RepID=UPI0011099682|nr:transporter substrate-binding domain-containing protein [Poseidonocella sp. HB161398]
MTSEETWPIGVVMSETGVTGMVERTQVAAVKLAVAEINAAGGVRGRPVVPLFRDPASTPARYRDLTLELCRDHGVRVIFGGHMSSTRKAMLPMVEAQNALLFYPTLYEGFEYSRHCIYTGAAPNQNSVPLVDYLFGTFGRRLLLIGSDYVYPYESNRIVGDLFRSKGGEILGETYVPLDLRGEHVARLLDLVRETQPDMIYSTLVGDGIVRFYEAYRAAGFDPETLPIASQSTSEVDVLRMAPGTAEGHVIAAPFFDSLDTPAAAEFTRAFHAATGGALPVTAPAEAAYFSVHLYARALALAGEDGIDRLLPALYEVEYEAPQGPVRVDRLTNHTHLWPRVARIREGAPYEIVSAPKRRVPPDPYLIEIVGDEEAADPLAAAGN